HAIELMPPQVQLGGVRKTGKLVRKSRWTTAEQLPVTDFRMSRRRLGPGERAVGVVVFQRPSFKQSNETLFLQMAESGAVDRSAFAPIGLEFRVFGRWLTPKWLWMLLLQPNPSLWTAIEHRRMIQLVYHRKHRVLEPHD